MGRNNMKKVLATSLLVLVGLTACGGGNSSISSNISSSTESSINSTNSFSSSLSSENSEYSSSNSSLSSKSSSEEDDDSIPEEVLVTVTVEQALEIIKGLKANSLSEQRYEITCYIREITEDYDAVKNCMSFNVSTTMDSTAKLLAFNTSAENKIDFQEYKVGTKIKLNGSLRKAGSDSEYTATIYAPTVEIVESMLVDATGLEIENLSLKEGKSAELSMKWSPENARKEAISWTIEDESIVSINENNIATGLKVGSTKVTAKTKSFEKTITITVNKDESNKVEIRFDQFPGGDIPTTATKAENVIGQIVGSGADYLESCDEATNVYIQPLCLRLGNSSKAGSVTFTLKEEIKVSQVIVSAKQYNTDVSLLSFSYTGLVDELPTQEPKDKMAFADFTFDVGGASFKQFKLSNSAKRLYIESVTFLIA